MKISWANPKIEYKDAGTGKGAFAVEAIKKDETIAVYGGFVIEISEIEKNTGEVLDVILDKAYQIEEELVFAPIGSEQFTAAEYVNHSCEANCGFKNRLTLVAMRDIEQGEELFLDYAMCMTTHYFDMDCLCGKENCRGKITGEDWKREELQSKYGEYFQPYIKDKLEQLKNNK